MQSLFAIPCNPCLATAPATTMHAAACLAAGKQAVDKARPETIAHREEGKEKANTENMRKHERYF